MKDARFPIPKSEHDYSDSQIIIVNTDWTTKTGFKQQVSLFRLTRLQVPYLRGNSRIMVSRKVRIFIFVQRQ